VSESLTALSRLSAESRDEVQRTGDAGALRVLALIDLVTAREAVEIERSVVQLSEVQARAGDDAVLRNELAVAYAARAALQDDPSDLYRALDQLERAVAIDSGSALLEFNRALILDRLHLTGESSAAWARSRSVETDAGWSAEVRSRSVFEDPDGGDWFRRELSRMRAGEWTGLDSAVARYPQVAREHVQDVLLPAWGRAVLSGAAGRAELDVAVAVAERLRRVNGDRTLEDALTEIGRSVDGATLRLARGWSEYGEGRALFRDANLTRAGSHLEEAVIAFRGTTLQGELWARLYRAVVTMYAFEYERAEMELRQLVAVTDAAVQGSLAARLHWALGFSLTRRGAAGEAVPWLETGVRLARAVGEAESEAATGLILAEALGVLGRPRGAAQAVARSAELYRSNRGSTSLHSLLLVTGRRLAQTGLPYAGVAVHREGLRVAAATGRPKDPIEAHTWLARAQTDAGAVAAAEHSLSEAERLVPALEDTLMRNRLQVEILAARAQVVQQTDPQEAIALLSPVIAYHAAGQLAVGHRDALSRRASARLQAGDMEGALADNTRVIETIERQLSGLAPVGARAALLDSAVAAFDGVIGIHAAAANTDVALEYAERSRAIFPARMFASGRGRAADTVSVPFLRDRLREGVVILEYAVLPDRLLVWAIERGLVTAGESPIHAAALEALIDRFVNLVRIAADSAVLNSLATELWSHLIGPVRSELTGGEELVIVGDRALHSLPFGALRSPAGRYLIQDHALRHAPSATFVASAAQRRSSMFTGRLLLVGDPARDTTVYPELEALPAVARELAGVAALNEGAMQLAGRAATRRGILDDLPEFSRFHFAGHALLRSDRPDQSYLVVAPEPGGGGSTIHGSDIADLDLRGLDLAILSACATLTPAGTRNGGLSGLAHSFLAAGAGGVIGTLWAVADPSTADLMIALHESLREGLDPSQALRRAQLRLITSGQPGLSRPAAWAPFRYEGR
jgi:CHAT domain-containing protein